MNRHSSFALMLATSLLTAAGCGGPTIGPSAQATEGTLADGAQLEHPAAPAPAPAEPDAVIELSAVPESDARRLDWQSAYRRLVDIENVQQDMDIVADMNQRPIRVWTVKGAGGTRAIRLIGHADGECCPLISEAVQSVVDRPEFSDAWSSYGYGHIVASDAAEEAALAQLGVELERRAKRRECAGQVVVTHARGADVIEEGSAELARTARKAYARAAAIERPLLVWHEFRDHPRIVPAYSAENGSLRPLEFRIPSRVLAIPASVKGNLSMDGVGQGIATLSAKEAELRRLIQRSSLVVGSRTRGWKANYRDPIMIPRIQEANKRIDDAIAEWQAQPASMPMRSAMLQKLRALRSKNASALSLVSSLPLTPVSHRSRQIEYSDVEQDTSTIDELRSQRTEVQAALARLQAMASTPKVHSEQVLTDAFLRGWPASFTSASIEKDFDNWTGARQRTVWEAVQKELSGRGLRLGAGPDGAPPELLMSNVFFRVRVEGDAMRVTPYFILAGTVALVADPGAKVVRYESSAADQNLVKLGGGAP